MAKANAVTTKPTANGGMLVQFSFKAKGAARAAIEKMNKEGVIKERFLKTLAQSLEDAAAAEESAAQESAAGDTQVRTWKRAIVNKADNDQRYVLGIVAEPESEDTQGDKETEVTIQKAAFGFMEAYAVGYGTTAKRGHVGKMHKSIVDGKVVVLESYVSRAEETVEGETIKKGSWVMAVRVRDDEMWEAVKKGDLTGFSFGGTAVRVPVAD